MNSKLRQQEQEQSAALEQSAQQKTVQEFGTPEELLRYDAAQITVPPAVAVRVQESVARENLQPPRSWWQRLLGKSELRRRR